MSHYAPTAQAKKNFAVWPCAWCPYDVLILAIRRKADLRTSSDTTP